MISILVVSSFCRETTEEIQSTRAHVVIDVQNKMAPVESREKQKFVILNHIINECQRRKRIQQCINKHAYSSKKNNPKCLPAFTAYSFTCQE